MTRHPTLVMITQLALYITLHSPYPPRFNKELRALAVAQPGSDWPQRWPPRSINGSDPPNLPSPILALFKRRLQLASSSTTLTPNSFFGTLLTWADTKCSRKIYGRKLSPKATSGEHTGPRTARGTAVTGRLNYSYCCSPLGRSCDHS